MGHLSETATLSLSTSPTRRMTCGEPLDATALTSNAIQIVASKGPFDGRFGIDKRTGFMAPRIRPRLPTPWDLWEDVLDAARAAHLQVGDKIGLTLDEAAASEAWRRTVRQMDVLSTKDLETSETLLRHAHVVLAHILNFYVHSLPPSSPISIPSSISVPALSVAQKLHVPPVITYADNVLYNWTINGLSSRSQHSDDMPTVSNIRSLTTFTNLVDEEEFYLVSARIELRGVEALDLMSMTLNETRNVSDDVSSRALAVERVTGYLQTLTTVLGELKGILLGVKKLCDPDIYYNQVRPWLRGEDAFSTPVRKWVFEGIEEHPELHAPTELSGPSAGQSCLIHALDAFFGVDHEARGSDPSSGSASSAGATVRRTSLMTRMQEYMPLEHRHFLQELRKTAPSLRRFVVDAENATLLAAFNGAVGALKAFRDAHMIIVTLYILGPARRAAALQKVEAQTRDSSVQSRNGAAEVVKGTGGTELVQFLKETRTHTTDALLS